MNAPPFHRVHHHLSPAQDRLSPALSLSAASVKGAVELAPLAGVRHPPCCDDRYFFAGFHDGTVGAFSLTDGRPVWRTPALFHPHDPSELRPVRIGATIYVGGGRGLYQLNASSGAVIAKTSYEYSPDLAFSLIAGPHLIVPLTLPDWQSAVLFFALGDATPRLRAALRSSPIASACTATHAAIAQSRGHLSMFDLVSGGLRWEWDASGFHSYPDPVERAVTHPGRIVAGPFLFRDLVLLGLAGHRLVALDARSGAVRWQTDVPIFAPSSLAVTDDGQFWVMDQNHLCVGQAVSGTLNRTVPLARSVLQSPTKPTPAGELIWCNDIQSGSLLAVSINDGQIILQDSIGAPVPQGHAPVISQPHRSLLVVSADSSLHHYVLK